MKQIQFLRRSIMRRVAIDPAKHHGFALVVTLSLMILLTLIAVGLLSLSAVTLRTNSQANAQSEAQANARLALMIAIGELQKEMGPDMRVSAESALFDTDKDTGEIEGVAQSRWLASYDAWGDWLNASYTPPGKPSTSIGATYNPGRNYYDSGRKGMFRRWLLSLPEGRETDINSPNSSPGSSDPNWVKLVGKGSLGFDEDNHEPEEAKKLHMVTRAYLTKVGNTGRHAWWISPENHKARMDMARKPRSLAMDAWQTAQGETAEVGVGALDGFNVLDDDATLGDRLVTTNALRNVPLNIDPDVNRARVEERFFDLTAHSKGVLASVRTGHLKKDLSLLFEKENKDLPAPYKYNSGALQEPSIRPMSAELSKDHEPSIPGNQPVPNRHFASWTNMRHYYQMYRGTGDATQTSTGATKTLKWSGSQPSTEVQIPLLYRDISPKDNMWLGNNSYLRLPVLAKLTFIYSLVSERVSPGSTTDLRYRLYLVYTPVFTYWNPYNTELRIPDNTLGCLSSTYQVLPMRTRMYLGNAAQGASPSSLFTGNAHSFLRSGDGKDIIFKPGEIRLFSHKTIGPQTGGQGAPLNLEPGFNPMAYGGDRVTLGTFTEAQNPGVVVQFSHSEWGGNVSYGNTPGSLCHTPFWLPQSADRGLAFNWNYPVMYQNDWFNLAQTYTPMTPPGPAEICRWVFTDSFPLPVAYAQLVIKGLSPFNYESINWAKDWRSRNWIQSPPFYFGNSLYISENETIAHTQRVDNPYVMNFGPLNRSEIPKVVGHLGNQAYLGSGSSPFEEITSAPVLELPTAPLGSLAGFSGMKINPGWVDPRQMNPELSIEGTGGNNTSKASYFYSINKVLAYQSGVTGPGIGNSFMHPMIPRTDVYQYFNNSVSQDPVNRTQPLGAISPNDNKVFCDYWDHVFLLNDALWDDYFVSSLADQKRGYNNSPGLTLSSNLDRFVAGEAISNTRYRYHSGGLAPAKIKSDLQAADGYLKAAKHLMVDGMFNVNSTSVAAWYSLFAGIRERQLVYRDDSGALKKVSIPPGKRIALSRFETEVSNQEMTNPGKGVAMPDGSPGWSGVRFLDDGQLAKLAEECVKQVKKRGPFLNFSEFINRRLSNDDLGLVGALQNAIDYDDKNADSGSINYNFKKTSGYMLKKEELGTHSFKTPEAAEGSRLAGIPGYVIQSDLLKPIANTLSVRDDTFRIRAYGEALDARGKVTARAWCEAVVQRMPEYGDSANDADVPARLLNASGAFSDNPDLRPSNLRFGRKFRIESFRWLNAAEV